MTPEQLAKSGSEHGEQRAFFSELQRLAPDVNAMTFAIPNGGQRHIKVALDLKAEGVKAGVPDIFCAIPCKGYAGLFIEMKRVADKAKKRSKGTTQDNQDEWHERLRARGYFVVVCYGWQEALDATRSYIIG